MEKPCLTPPLPRFPKHPVRPVRVLLRLAGADAIGTAAVATLNGPTAADTSQATNATAGHSPQVLHSGVT
jgi:hypothetical protein